MQPVIWNTCHILFQAHMSSLIYLMILISECIQNRTDYHLTGVKSKTRRNYSNGPFFSLYINWRWPKLKSRWRNLQPWAIYYWTQMSARSWKRKDISLMFLFSNIDFTSMNFFFLMYSWCNQFLITNLHILIYVISITYAIIYRNRVEICIENVSKTKTIPWIQFMNHVFLIADVSHYSSQITDQRNNILKRLCASHLSV